MIYWQSPRHAPPPDAQFRLIPFPNGAPLALRERITTLPAPYASLQPVSRTDVPHKSAWCAAVREALGCIHNGALQKVVLARETTLHFDEPLDPWRLTAFLQTRARGATVFCCELSSSQAFLGASPERLFRREGPRITTEAVAGTRRRGAAQGVELLRSEKELREFRHVEEHLERALAPLCSAPLIRSEIRLHETANVQHLFSETTGTLHAATSDDALLEALQPTPAVCGAPRAAALTWLQKHEPFARGHYAGVVGWSTPTSAEWVVAIRSGVVEGHKLKLYAGTGIVAGSDPENEWNELEAKLGLYLD